MELASYRESGGERAEIDRGIGLRWDTSDGAIGTKTPLESSGRRTDGTATFCGRIDKFGLITESQLDYHCLQLQAPWQTGD